MTYPCRYCPKPLPDTAPRVTLPRQENQSDYAHVACWTERQRWPDEEETRHSGPLWLSNEYQINKGWMAVLYLVLITLGALLGWWLS